jgi:hypothetical protein
MSRRAATAPSEEPSRQLDRFRATATVILAALGWTTRSDIGALFVTARPPCASVGWVLPSIALPALIGPRRSRRVEGTDGA